MGLSRMADSGLRPQTTCKDTAKYLFCTNQPYSTFLAAQQGVEEMVLNVEPSCKTCTCHEEVDLSHVEKILAKYNNDRAELLSILEEVQADYGYLPQNALRMVAERTGSSMVDVFGVATFYRAFNLKPRGKHCISVCMGTACHVKGAPNVVKEFERQLGISVGETTPDNEFTLETVNCLGASALGPIVMVDGHYFSHVTPAKVKWLLSMVRAGLDKVDVKTDSRIIHLDVLCPHCNQSLMDSVHPIDGCPSIHTTITFNGVSGHARLSSLYGSYSIQSEPDAPVGTTVDFFCPSCNKKLTTTSRCPECGELMALMRVSGGGVVQICTQRGCKGHILDLSEIDI